MRSVITTIGVLVCALCLIPGCGKQESQSTTSISKNLKVDDYQVQGDLISGTATNTSRKTLSYVEIDFALYDADGKRIGTTTANTSNLQPQSSWSFQALVSADNVSKVDICATRAY